jgi:hypothetical protein
MGSEKVLDMPKAYTKKDFEEALYQLWDLVERRLTREDLEKLGVTSDDMPVSGIFDELRAYGCGGLRGFGIGRMVKE